MKNLKILLISTLISIATVLSYGDNLENKRTLLIFGAKWCKYCQVAKKDMESNIELSEMVKTYEIIELDMNKDKDVVDGHNVKSIPTFVIFEKGKEIKRHAGYRGPSDLIKFLK